MDTGALRVERGPASAVRTRARVRHGRCILVARSPQGKRRQKWDILRSTSGTIGTTHSRSARPLIMSFDFDA